MKVATSTYQSYSKKPNLSVVMSPISGINEADKGEIKIGEVNDPLMRSTLLYAVSQKLHDIQQLCHYSEESSSLLRLRS